MKSNKLALVLFDESMFRLCYLASFFLYMISYKKPDCQQSIFKNLLRLLVRCFSGVVNLHFSV